MANALYPTFKAALLNKEHDLDSDIIMASLLDGADETYAGSDNTYTAGASGIADASKVAATSLSSLSITSGTFDSADFTWPSVTGDQSEIILLWNNTHASDALIAWYDTGVTGLPVTPNGGDINVTVHTSGWFAL